MPSVTYNEPSGAVRTVEVPVGQTVMEGALKNDVRGIDADCGGACSCATCHVYVDSAHFGRLPEMSEVEREMLQYANTVSSTSRLSCQLKMSEALDGLVVTVPAEQG